MMPPTVFAFALFALTFIGSQANAATVEHSFHIRNLTVSRMCKEKVIVAVNGQHPGPAIQVTEGDSVVVHVVNESPFDMTIHWHGVFQLGSAWADGANMVTQCPIRPGKRLTYKFNVTGQEGTLWWHAHVSYHRVTVHGPLIIRPKRGTEALPFPKPDDEVTIILGEWWSADVVNAEKEVMRGIFSTISDAFTINGYPGDLYNCSENYKLEVEYGKTYLLRIINAALNNEFFYKVADHTFTVVGVDATYTKPYKTDVIVIAPGQTVDAIMVADSTPACYYMAASPYAAEDPLSPYLENTTTRGILQYKSTSLSSSPMMPPLPTLRDTPTAHRFYTSITSLLLPGQPTVPLHVDECMFITIGIGTLCKGGEEWCELIDDRMVVSSMNNVSFRLPKEVAMLEAHFNKSIEGVFTTDFPNKPPLFFDFANASLHNGTIEESLEPTAIGTKVKKLKYNTTVEIVLQSTAIMATQSHPMHIHGFNFFVVAQGFGNYNDQKVRSRYNLVDPQVRNTIAVPTGGWVVIRFTANNPGVWLMHCHMDLHLPIGLATAFVVENGPTPDTTLPLPPADFPPCSSLDVARSESIWNNQDKSDGKESYL